MKAVTTVVLLALFSVALAKINPTALGKISITTPSDDYTFGAIVTARDGFVVAAVDYTAFAQPVSNSTLYSFDVRGDSPKLVNSIVLPNSGPTTLFSANGGAIIYAICQANNPQTPVIVDVVMTSAGQIVIGRSIVFPEELSDKIVIFGQTNRLADHIYLIDRNIWSIDRTAWQLKKGAALEWPSNGNLFSGDFNWNDKTVSLSGYQMCLFGGKPCDAEDPNMGTWFVQRHNTSTGKAITSTRIANTEWVVLADTASNEGIRIADVKSTSISVTPFDFAQFKAGNAIPDQSSRPFTYSQRLPLTRAGNCLTYAWADAKSSDTDKVRLTQLAFGGAGQPPKVIDQQTLPVETTFLQFFVPWIATSGNRLYLAAGKTLYVHEASC